VVRLSKETLALLSVAANVGCTTTPDVSEGSFLENGPDDEEERGGDPIESDIVVLLW
jgi:hypothetical protein